MIKEFDVVQAKIKLSKKVSKGTLGTVVYCYGEKDFIVEFVDKNKQAIESLDVSVEKLKVIWKS